LMWAAKPDLLGEINATMDIVRSTATAKASSQSCGERLDAIPNNTYGFGIINALKSVEAALIN